MAHLANDLLPESFDVVVDGTGLTQSVLAGALARTGRSVLHLDRCGYYGELWATLLNRDFDEWLLEHTSGKVADEVPLCPIPEMEGKRPLAIKETPSSISNVVDFIPHTYVMIKEAEVTHKDLGAVEDLSTKASQSSDQAVPVQSPAQSSQSPAQSDSCTSAEQGGDKPVASSDVPSEATSLEEGGEEPSKKGSPPGQSPAPPKTWQSLDKRWFNYDLMPKPLYCRGNLINCLTETNIGRYLEFRAIYKLFTRAGDKIEQVPCSREDVFNTKVISMVEKRKLMKFLTFCMEFEKHPEEYQTHESTPYSEYLRLKDHTPNLIRYIVHTIAMVNDNTTTIEGLKSTQMFIKSLGRFGNAPFLFPIYGSGELTQSFCRFSAVWGSVYCLKRYIQALVLEDETKLVGVVCSSGQKITCKAVVTSANALRTTVDLCRGLRTKRLSRAIFITDGPLEGTEGAMTVVTIPPLSLGSNQTRPFRLLQLDHLSSCSVMGTYMIHITVESIQNTAHDDLHVIAKTFFNIEGHDDCNKNGPNLLRAVYFNVDTFGVDHSLVPSLSLPKDLHLVSDPDDSVSYEAAMSEAKEVFHLLCPGEPFLPATPNPEDIIYDDAPPSEHPVDNGDAPKSSPEGDSPPTTSAGEHPPAAQPTDTTVGSLHPAEPSSSSSHSGDGRHDDTVGPPIPT